MEPDPRPMRRGSPPVRPGSISIDSVSRPTRREPGRVKPGSGRVGRGSHFVESGSPPVEPDSRLVEETPPSTPFNGQDVEVAFCRTEIGKVPDDSSPASSGARKERIEGPPSP
jgi:hypothetical protein